MGKHSVDVHQLASDGNSFLNVDSGMGWVGVETHAYQRPTVLLRSGNTVRLMQFDDEMWMRDWLKANDIGWTIEHLDPLDKRVP